MDKKFTPFAVKTLSNNDTYALVSTSIKVAEPVQGEMGDVSQEIFKNMKQSNALLGEQINKPRKNKHSEDIKAEVTECKTRLSECKRDISSATKSTNAEKKKAGIGLEFFFKPYWEITSESTTTFHEVLSELFVKYYADQQLQAYARTLSIFDLLNEIQNYNHRLGELLVLQTKEKGETSDFTSSEIRLDVGTHYIQFCTAIEQRVQYKPTDAILKLFNQLDELRRTYHNKVAKPKTDSKLDIDDSVAQQ